MLKLVSEEELLSQVLEMFECASDQHYLTGSEGGKSIPVIVGAGVSATADIPLGEHLLTKLFSGLAQRPEVRSYEALFHLMRKTYPLGIEENEDLFNSRVQENFRDLLARSGIPRRSDHPFPNLSNLLLVHCVQSGFLGPLVSLNVDPLLQVAASFLEDGGPNLRYVQNISEFSDIVHDFETRLIIQPHGTIEEPVSLRFSDSSLMDKDSVLVEGISGQLEKALGALCIGFSWSNKVVEKIVESTIFKRRAGGRSYRLLVACYGGLENGDKNVLEGIDTKFGNSVEICIAEGIRSDDILEKLSRKIYEKTIECRDEGRSTYYARDPSRILALNRLVTWMHKTLESELSDATRWSYHSSLTHLLSIECILYFVAASDPSSLYDLIQFVYGRPYLHELGYSDPTEHSRVVREVIESLQEAGIIEAYQCVPRSDMSPRTLDEFDGSLHVLSSKLTMTSLCERVLSFLTLSGEGNCEAEMSERAKVLGSIFGSLEVSKKDRPQNTLRAIALATCFEKAQILDSSQALDELLDQLKYSFKRSAEEGADVNCYIYTETGDHLFKSEFYELRRTQWDDPQALKNFMLDWLKPLFNEDFPRARMKLLLPVSQASWRLDESERSARDNLIFAGLRALSKLPSITIGYLPWELHDDHMWLLRVQNGTLCRSEGALFPRRHHESNHCAIHIKSEHDVDVMIHAFESQVKLHSTAIEAVNRADYSSMPSWHVLAITLVDGETLVDGKLVGDSKICLGVRVADNNAQHKGVASVPTKKIPESLFWDIVRDCKLPSGDNEVLKGDLLIAQEHRGRNSLIYAVDDLIAAKLGVAEALESKNVIYSAKACILKSGCSPLISDDDRDEYIRMVNALVVMTSGAKLIPLATSSYSPMGWVTVDKFLRAVNAGTTVLSRGSESYEYICGGLCVCTSNLLLNEMGLGAQESDVVAISSQLPNTASIVGETF